MGESDDAGMLGAMNFSMPVGESEVVYSSVGDGVLKRGVIVKHRCERERRGDRGARGKVPVSSKGRIRRQEEWRLLACFWGEMRRARRYESAHLLLARLLAKAWPSKLGLVCAVLARAAVVTRARYALPTPLQRVFCEVKNNGEQKKPFQQLLELLHARKR